MKTKGLFANHYCGECVESGLFADPGPLGKLLPPVMNGFSPIGAHTPVDFWGDLVGESIIRFTMLVYEESLWDQIAPVDRASRLPTGEDEGRKGGPW
jgi:hypothetical protein